MDLFLKENLVWVVMPIAKPSLISVTSVGPSCSHLTHFSLHCSRLVVHLLLLGLHQNHSKFEHASNQVIVGYHEGTSYTIEKVLDLETWHYHVLPFGTIVDCHVEMWSHHLINRFFHFKSQSDMSQIKEVIVTHPWSESDLWLSWNLKLKYRIYN